MEIFCPCFYLTKYEIPPVVAFIIKFGILRTIKIDNPYYPPFSKLT